MSSTQSISTEKGIDIDVDNADIIVVLHEAHNKAKELLWPTLWQHWHLWPTVHMLNFYCLPLQHRVLVQNTVLVGWSGYLSHLNHHRQHNSNNINITSRSEVDARKPVPPRRRTSLVILPATSDQSSTSSPGGVTVVATTTASSSSP